MVLEILARPQVALRQVVEAQAPAEARGPVPAVGQAPPVALGPVGVLRRVATAMSIVTKRTAHAAAQKMVRAKVVGHRVAQVAPLANPAPRELEVRPDSKDRCRLRK